MEVNQKWDILLLRRLAFLCLDLSWKRGHRG